MMMTDAERTEIEAWGAQKAKERYAPGSVVMNMAPKFKVGDRVAIDTSFNGPIAGVVRKTRGADGVIAFDKPYADPTVAAATDDAVRVMPEASYQWSARGFRGSSYVAFLGPVRFEHEPPAPESEWLTNQRIALAASAAGAGAEIEVNGERMKVLEVTDLGVLVERGGALLQI